MGPTWVLSAPDGPHVGPMNLAIRVRIWDSGLVDRWAACGVLHCQPVMGCQLMEKVNGFPRCNLAYTLLYWIGCKDVIFENYFHCDMIFLIYPGYQKFSLTYGDIADIIIYGNEVQLTLIIRHMPDKLRILYSGNVWHAIQQLDNNDRHSN